MEPKIANEQKCITKNIENLTVVLANEMILYIKKKEFHWNVSGNWNVSGKSFMKFHKLFEAHYHSIELTIDEVSERISKLGGGSDESMSMSEFLNHSILKESTKNDTQEKVLLEILNDHEGIIINLRNMIAEMKEEYNDFGTVDFLKGVMQSHESKVWALRKYITN